MVKKAAEQATKQATKAEKRRIKELLEKHGVTLPPDVAAAVFGDAPPNGS